MVSNMFSISSGVFTDVVIGCLGIWSYANAPWKASTTNSSSTDQLFLTYTSTITNEYKSKTKVKIKKNIYNINDVILWFFCIVYHSSSKVLKILRETFVQPYIVPPLTGDQISEPLMSELVLHNYGRAHFHSRFRFVRQQQKAFPAKTKYITEKKPPVYHPLLISIDSPIFHRSKTQIWYRQQIHFRQHIRQTSVILQCA